MILLEKVLLVVEVKRVEDGRQPYTTLKLAYDRLFKAKREKTV